MTPSISQQLADSKRVIDCRGENIQIQDFEEAIISIHRERQANRHDDAVSYTDIVDCLTNEATANKMLVTFKAYLERFLGSNLTWAPDWQTVPELGDRFCSVALPKSNCILALMLSEAVGPQLMLIDWADLYDPNDPVIMNPRSHLVFQNLGPEVIELKPNERVS